MNRIPHLSGPVGESLVPRNRSRLPGDNVRQLLKVRQATCPHQTRFQYQLLGWEIVLRKLRDPKLQGRAQYQHSHGRGNGTADTSTENFGRRHQGNLALSWGKQRCSRICVISQKSATYLAGPNEIGAMLKTSTVRHKAEEVAAITIFHRHRSKNKKLKIKPDSCF